MAGHMCAEERGAKEFGLEEQPACESSRPGGRAGLDTTGLQDYRHGTNIFL